MKYRRLDMCDRHTIQFMLQEGYKQKVIALELGCHPSTISRELKRPRKSDGEYYFGFAEEDKEAKLRPRSLPRKFKAERLRFVIRSLESYHSPSQICARMRSDIGLDLHPETIYRFLRKDKDSGGSLFKILRRSNRKRKHRFPRHQRGLRKQENLPSIEQRPTAANDRLRIGDWERDTFFGLKRSSMVLILVDRRSRFTRLRLVNSLKEKDVTSKTIDAVRGLPVRSVTNDRGVEFCSYKNLAYELRKPIYFCHPFTSQERGTVENTIGLVRQFLPKRTDLAHIDQASLNHIEDLLNDRPRKTLGWKTPREILRENNCAV